MVMPIGKQDKDVHVPPVAEQKPTENDNAIPSVPAATSVAEGDGKNDAGRPSEASVEVKEERVAEPPSPSRLEDAPMGQDAIPRQSTCQKTVATDITKPKPQVLPIWETTEGNGQ